MARPEWMIEGKTPTVRENAKARFDSINSNGAHAKNILKHVFDVPDRFRDNYNDCLTGETTLATVVKLTCAECVGFEDTANAVRECKSWRCPIWLYRPHQD